MHRHRYDYSNWGITVDMFQRWVSEPIFHFGLDMSHWKCVKKRDRKSGLERDREFH